MSWMCDGVREKRDVTENQSQAEDLVVVSCPSETAGRLFLTQPALFLCWGGERGEQRMITFLSSDSHQLVVTQISDAIPMTSLIHIPITQSSLSFIFYFLLSNTAKKETTHFCCFHWARPRVKRSNCVRNCSKSVIKLRTLTSDGFACRSSRYPERLSNHFGAASLRRGGKC